MGLFNLFKKYKTLDVAQALELLDAGAVLVDVREREEFRAGHARQARHISPRTLLEEVPAYANGRPVITVCRSGARSGHAADLLFARGIEVYSLKGGMIAWQHAGQPIVSNGGKAGRVI